VLLLGHGLIITLTAFVSAIMFFDRFRKTVSIPSSSLLVPFKSLARLRILNPLGSAEAANLKLMPTTVVETTPRNLLGVMILGFIENFEPYIKIHWH